MIDGEAPTKDVYSLEKKIPIWKEDGETVTLNIGPVLLVFHCALGLLFSLSRSSHNTHLECRHFGSKLKNWNEEGEIGNRWNDGGSISGGHLMEERCPERKKRLTLSLFLDNNWLVETWSFFFLLRIPCLERKRQRSKGPQIIRSNQQQHHAWLGQLFEAVWRLFIWFFTFYWCLPHSFASLFVFFRLSFPHTAFAGDLPNSSIHSLFSFFSSSF